MYLQCALRPVLSPSSRIVDENHCKILLFWRKIPMFLCGVSSHAEPCRAVALATGAHQAGSEVSCLWARTCFLFLLIGLEKSSDI